MLFAVFWAPHSSEVLVATNPMSHLDPPTMRTRAPHRRRPIGSSLRGGKFDWHGKVDCTHGQYGPQLLPGTPGIPGDDLGKVG